MKKVTKILAIIFGVIAADQLSKGYLIYLLTGRVPGMVDAWDLVSVPYLIRQVNAFLNIVFTWNPGASFSLLRGVGEYAPWAIALITAAIVGFILHYLFRRSCDPEQVPLALIAGGAIGNLIDRVRFGAVVDFIDAHVGGWHWPAFNVADTCIVLGVALFILKWYIERRKCTRAM
ncbi:signal peptidase II [bacterium]|nr:signal peptidase II [bacterium]